MTPESVFVRDGERYQPTEWSVGPWAPDAVQGSATAALLASRLERLDAPQPVVLSRLAFDLWRPVTRQPLTAVISVLREGRRARTVEASLVQEGQVVTRCTALFLRADPGATPPWTEPRPTAPGPEAGRPIPARVQAWSPFFGGVDTRVLEGDLLAAGPATVWFRLTRPLVAGEANSSLVQAVSAADLTSGISAVADLRAWSFVNADLTVELWRPPAGEWILVRAETRVGPAGTGAARGVLSDPSGEFGSCAQSLIFERRAG
jgi:acyl-CoA thioesterase